MNKKAKIVMLPAKERTNILRNKYKFSEAHGNPLVFDDNTIDKIEERGYIPQHLYVTIDKRPKNGDWYIYNGELLRQQNDKFNKTAKLLNKNHVIIATTDKSLKITDNNLGENWQGIFPGIEISFIKKYCNLGGVNKVTVEYKEFYIDAVNGKKINYFGFEFDDAVADGSVIPKKVIVPKINSDNTVNIELEKNSWSRKEVSLLLFKFLNRPSFDLPNGQIGRQTQNDFEKENL